MSGKSFSRIGFRLIDSHDQYNIPTKFKYFNTIQFFLYIPQ